MDDDSEQTITFSPAMFGIRVTGLTPEECRAVLGKALSRSALYRKYHDPMLAMGHEVTALMEEEYRSVIKAKGQTG